MCLYRVPQTYLERISMYVKDIESKYFPVDKVISGWLLSDGTFDECLYGEHSELATEIIKEHGWYKEWRSCKTATGRTEYSRDFLVFAKKAILLDNPACNEKTQHITFNPSVKHSKAQINKIYELFADNQEITRYLIGVFENE